MRSYFFVTATAALMMAFGPPAATPVEAGAPQVRAQAPGFYRYILGDYEVTALLDGTHGLNVDDLAVGAKPGEVAKDLARVRMASPVEGMINAFLVNTGEKLILIDTGAGELYGKDGGLLVSNLAAAGYRPEQIDEIFLTHLHRDHVGGAMLAGKAVFPNAVIHASKRDADFWLDNANRAKAAPFLGNMFDGAQTVLAPYRAAGRFKTFDHDEEVAPGIRAMLTPGHTPGHTYYAVESKGQKLLIWGDTIHFAAVQFEDPDVAIRYDSDEKAAIAARRKVFADAAANGYVIAASHISFPGLGHVRDEGQGRFTWVPINYSLNR
jgi:glyoxylase-like metal-dependent hydrolase (beta-lactamase superfamily II)